VFLGRLEPVGHPGGGGVEEPGNDLFGISPGARVRGEEHNSFRFGGPFQTLLDRSVRREADAAGEERKRHEHGEGASHRSSFNVGKAAGPVGSSSAGAGSAGGSRRSGSGEWVIWIPILRGRVRRKRAPSP